MLLSTVNYQLDLTKLSEAVAYQTHDLFEAMKHDGLRPKIVKVDGGMVMNNWFSQFLSDVVNVKVYRPKVHETTASKLSLIIFMIIGKIELISVFLIIKKIFFKD